jgi:hypothetical protein
MQLSKKRWFAFRKRKLFHGNSGLLFFYQIRHTNEQHVSFEVGKTLEVKTNPAKEVESYGSADPEILKRKRL